MDKSGQTASLHLKKLLSNARAILTNQIAIPLGAQKMNKIITWLGQSGYRSKIDLTVFQIFADSIDGCPVGTERLLWEKEALKLQDRIIDKAVAQYRDTIVEKCFEIIELYEAGGQ